MQHLTFKNMVLAFLSLNVISAFVINSQFRDTQVVSQPHDRLQSPKAPSSAPEIPLKQPEIVKVLDLPDSETLRFNETTFVDLGWRQTLEKGGEWVGHIGSGTEYLPLNAGQIAGMLKEAQLKSLPLPPVARAPGDRKRQQMAGKSVEAVGHNAPDIEHVQLSGEHISGLLDDLQPLALPPAPPAVIPRSETTPPETPAVEPKTAPSTPKGINLLNFIPVMLGIFFMMYVRYRITQATLDAAQNAAGTAQRALSQFFSAAKASVPVTPAAPKTAAVRSPFPVSTSAPVKKTSRSSTVVRPAPGLFGLWSRAR